MSKLTFNPAKIYFIISMLIVVMLIVMGLFLMFSDMFAYIPDNFRFIIGLFIIAYGSFRLVTIYYKSKSKNDEDEM